jgi:hypothetical protein
MTTPLPDPFTGNHGALEDKVRELSLLPPAHNHLLTGITLSGARSAETVVHGDGVLRPLSTGPIDVVGTPGSPITDAETPRPEGFIIVIWLCVAGLTPTFASGADIIWNKP